MEVNEKVFIKYVAFNENLVNCIVTKVVYLTKGKDFYRRRGHF